MYLTCDERTDRVIGQVSVRLMGEGTAETLLGVFVVPVLALIKLKSRG